MNRDRFKATLEKGWVGALVAALTGFVVLWLPFTEGIVNLSYDLPFFFRNNIPGEGVKIIYMDDESHKVLNQPWHGAWDRSLHARLIDNLNRWHAKAIVFDVLFLATNVPSADAELVRATKDSGKVVLASIMAPDVNQGSIEGWKLTKAFTPLKDVAVSGVVEEGGKNKVIRRHFRNTFYPEPSMAWQAAKLAISDTPQVGGASVPASRLVDPFRERWVNYYGPPGFIPHVSYFSALDPRFDGAAAFSNKVVFIGAQYDVGFTGGKTTDDFGTPYTRWTNQKSPGVEINATTFLNLVRVDWLSRLPAWIETALFLLTGALAGFGLAAFRPLPATLFAVVAGLLASIAAIAVVWQTHVWIPWLSIVAVQIPIGLGWSVLIHTKRLTREKRSLEQALAMAHRGDPAPDGPRPVPVRSGTPDSDPFFHRAYFTTPTAHDKPRPAIADHELLRCIGGGAYGEVWLARDIIGSFHAVKVVYRDSFKDPRPLEREFNGLKKFTPISRSHPGFVNVLQVGRNNEGGYIYYVMELGDDQVTGQKIDPENYSAKTLANELQKRKSLPLPECLEIMIHLAGALEYLHQQHLIHRDIKPSNLIFVNGVCKFADIGLVTDIATDGRDVTYLGTPGRIPPEGPGASTSDVYSLGKVLYEMSFGLDLERFPELPTAVVERGAADALLALNRIVMKACENDPRRRYQTAAEFRADLIALQKKLPCPANI